MPSGGDTHLFQVLLCPCPPQSYTTPKLSFALLQGLGVFLRTLSKAEFKSKKNTPVCPTFLCSRAVCGECGCAGLLKSRHIKILPAQGWIESSVKQSFVPYLVPQLPTQLFFSISHLSQKSNEAGRILGASPGLVASLCVGRAFNQVLPQTVLF